MNPNVDEQLHLAAQEGDIEEVRLLLHLGADVNAFDEIGMTALHYAAAGEHLRVIELLLDNGAQVNARHEPTFSDTPLAHVAATCSLELARLLVNAGADPTVRGWMQLNALDRSAKRLRAPGPEVHALLSAKARRAGHGMR